MDLATRAVVVARCESCSRPVFRGFERPVRTCMCHWQAQRGTANGGLLVATDAQRDRSEDLRRAATPSGGWGCLAEAMAP